MDEQRETDQQGGPMHAPQAPPEPGRPFGPVANTERLAHDLVALRTVAPATGIGAALMRRLDTSGAPGRHAAGLGGRFAPRALRAEPLQMTVSPYAPPQRQLSTARQGAPMWSPPAVAARPAAPGAGPDPSPDREASAAPSTPPRAAPSDPSELPSDLKALLALHRAKGNM